MNTTTLTKPNAEAMKEWQELNNVSPFPRPNEIRLSNSPMDGTEKNEDFGKLFATSTEDGVETREEIPLDKAEFKFIGCRIIIKCGKFDAENQPLVKVSGEIDDTRTDYITVTPTDGADEVTGLYKDLKEDFPLKYTENVYVEWDGNVYRWNLTGAHFDSWFKAKNVLQKEPHVFSVTGMNDEKTGSNVYKSLVFAVGDPYPVTEALTLRKELDVLLGGSKQEAAKEEVQKIEDVPYEEPYKKN